MRQVKQTRGTKDIDLYQSLQSYSLRLWRGGTVACHGGEKLFLYRLFPLFLVLQIGFIVAVHAFFILAGRLIAAFNFAPGFAGLVPVGSTAC